jgi:hypothetical protein
VTIAISLVLPDATKRFGKIANRLTASGAQASMSHLKNVSKVNAFAGLSSEKSFPSCTSHGQNFRVCPKWMLGKNVPNQASTSARKNCHHQAMPATRERSRFQKAANIIIVTGLRRARLASSL